MMFPKQWYTQRSRSESHTSSDPEQYRDAPEYLDIHSTALSTSAQVNKVSSSAAEYLDLDLGGASHFLAPEAVPLLVSSIVGVVALEEEVVVEDIEVSCDPSHDQVENQRGNSQEEEVKGENGGNKKDVLGMIFESSYVFKLTVKGTLSG